MVMKPGREKRTVLVAVDLFENQAQHRGIDQGFVVFLYLFASFAAEKS
jgi:hypothetical protein